MSIICYVHNFKKGKGVGVHEWKKGSFEFENYPSFSFKRADIDYITNYKINQNVGKKIFAWNRIIKIFA